MKFHLKSLIQKISFINFHLKDYIYEISFKEFNLFKNFKNLI